MKPYSERLKNAEIYYNKGMESVKSKPEPVGQKFKIGTFVKVKHWIMGDLIGKVQYTYAHAYGGNDVENYSLLVRYAPDKWSAVSWFKEQSLTEIKGEDSIAILKKELGAI